MPRIIDLSDPTHEQEWRSLRGLGSADASAIMNTDRWATPFSIWELKTRRRDYTPTTEWMKRGIDNEPLAIKEFEFQFGADYPKTRMIHSQYPFIKAEFDGWNAAINVGVEVKTAGKEDHNLALNGLIPPHYQWRLDHLLMISDGDKVAYFSYDPDQGGTTVWYYRDEERIKKLLDAEITFWSYITNDTPPPLTLRDYNIREDDDWQEAATGYKHWDSILKQAEMNRDKAQQRLVELSQKQSTLGSGVKVLFYTKKGSIAYKKATEDLVDIMGEKIDIEKYRGEDQLITKVSLV